MDPLELLDDVCFGAVELEIEEGPEANLPEATIARVTFPTMMFLDKATPDGRQFAANGFDSRDLPLSILYKDKTTHDPGHAEARLVGSLRSVDVKGGIVSGWGYLADLPAARECLIALKSKSIRGVSADLTEVQVAEPSQADLAENPRLRFIGQTAKLSALTFVPIPAFPDAYGELDRPPLGLVASARIIRSVRPSRAWFADPHLDEPTGVVVTKEGRVFGHLATWDTCHVGHGGCRRPPRDDDFSFFHNGGTVLCDNDELVRVGRIFMGGDHADPTLTPGSALDHYAATSLAWGDVVVGADDVGIWVAGAMRPRLSEHLAYQARASALSGDWRPIDGRLHLFAILSVNGPGFPIRDSGTALIASGPQPTMQLEANIELGDEITETEGRLFPDVALADIPTSLSGATNQDHAGLLRTLREAGFRVLVGRNGAGRAELANAGVTIGPAPSGLRWDASGRSPGVVPSATVELALPAWGEALVNVSRATIEVAIAVAAFASATQPGQKISARQTLLEAVASRDAARSAVFDRIDPGTSDSPTSDYEIAKAVLEEHDDLMEGLAPVIAEAQNFEIVPTPVIPVRA